MNKPFTWCTRLTIVLLSCSLFSYAQLPPAEKHTGFLSVSATITISKEAYESMLLDSLVWHDVKPLVKSYLGKRIKQMIYHKNSGRVVVYFTDRDNIVIKKDRTLKDGLFDPDPVICKLPKYIPEKPIDQYLDSPLYIGVQNEVILHEPEASDNIIPHPHVQATKNNVPGSYSIAVNRPGKVFILFADSASGKIRFVYHGIAKRLPGDGPSVEPVITLGNINNSNTDTATLRQQRTLHVNSNFTIVSGSAYFTGTGFRDVIVTDVDKNLTYAKPYIDLCMPGATIIFDELLVSDPSGKLYSAESFSISVTDDSFRIDPSIDYYSLTTYPQFLWGEGSLEYYVREQLAVNKNLTAAGQQVSFVMKIETDGSVSPVSEAEQGTLSPLEKKCFEIIGNGPAWTPGSFKGTPVAMTVTFFCRF